MTIRKLFVFLFVLHTGVKFSIGSSSQCSTIVNEYLQRHHKEPSPYTSDDQLVYFLHVPRTAGRTLHSCLLKLGMEPKKRCPKAYDHLRINFTVPNCHLLSSHDDYSVVSMLPENVAVLTHLRDPVDRFLSAYEFAIEVGARAAIRPPNFRKRPNKVATEDVWPWSYLVPWFAEIVKERVGATLQGTAHHACHMGGMDSYLADLGLALVWHRLYMLWRVQVTGGCAHFKYLMSHVGISAAEGKTSRSTAAINRCEFIHSTQMHFSLTCDYNEHHQINNTSCCANHLATSNASPCMVLSPLYLMFYLPPKRLNRTHTCGHT